MLQVLGLVALINTHKVSKARHSAELGSMRYRPVRKSLSFKECFTILAGTFIVATATSVVVLTAAALPEMKEIYKLEMKRMDRWLQHIASCCNHPVSFLAPICQMTLLQLLP